MSVAAIMAKPAAGLPGTWTVADTLAFFTAPDTPKRHKSYPVTDEEGRVIGMVARADAMRWLREDLQANALLRDQVAGQDRVFGYDDELAGHLADRMALAQIRRVPIINRKSGVLVGLVARRDLLRVRANAVQYEREREALIRLSR